MEALTDYSLARIRAAKLEYDEANKHRSRHNMKNDTARNRTIAAQRYIEGMTLEEIAKVHKITRQRVCQILQKKNLLEEV